MEDHVSDVIMNNITWLHLSDWHQRGKDFDRRIIRDALIKDIKNRVQISPQLKKIDFIIFSGDVAWSGTSEQYSGAINDLFDPLLQVTGLPKECLFIIPGNHDLDETEFRFLPEGIKNPFQTENEVQQWLNYEKERNYLLTPFTAYQHFVTTYTGQESPGYASIRQLEIRGQKVALLGLNSALMCRRNKQISSDGEKVNDNRFLIVGEHQIYNALNKIIDDDLKIVVLHHPLDWLIEFDQTRIESRLLSNFHFLLHGHRHYPQIRTGNSSEGDCVIISGGASYDRRIPTDPRYNSSYNFVHLNFENGKGNVYWRRWSDRRNGGAWIEDTETYKDGQYEFPLPQQLLPK
ncbi:metallophosphoesterase family protein [Aphanothece sacrum]|uniref:Metallophosphoesterase n=1 Tax=Aphanothece sacrum FPU1 TaxID=1920663 RepID=A0A401IKW8_APHSA|nr:metallophosphoesterase [Aphanothece sacrum]GBF81891.1 metallophosphoesterase [Aphanothece sacrum FPU1]GBF83520.1 metallophosphoesterase [Aphanothece sacrum FPU3]